MINQTPSPKSLRSERRPVSTSNFGFWAAVQTITSTAVIVATLLTLWSPTNIFSGDVFNAMIKAINSTPEAQVALPTSPVSRLRIGIVAGHYGFDSGAVCEDGVTEQSVNMKIATLVRQDVLKTNPELQVDLLGEYDSRLNGYDALALVSIHNDSCKYTNNEATGYKVAAAAGTSYPEKANRLAACLIDRYRKKTGLAFHENTITPDMTQYHAFTEINSDTPAVIIETGFLNLDYRILTEQTDLVASGVADGILCYIHNESISPSGINNMQTEQAVETPTP
jgi:N-acetylmuramoyl-L-alanine amidase